MPLVTPSLAQIQREALALRENATITGARDQAIALFKASDSATVADGLSTLEGALDEMIFGVLLGIAGNNPLNPEVVWSGHLPYTSHGLSVPGSRYADSPDRIYRSIPVNPDYSYEITGRRNPLYPSLDFSIEAIPPPSLWGQPTDSLQARDIEVAGDGTFTITADAGGAEGRKNHLQLAPGTTNILIRDTLSDWASQRPNGIRVAVTERVGEQPPKPAEIAERAASEIVATAQSTVAFLEQMVWNKPVNQLSAFQRTVEQGMPGGIFAASRFSVADDEALVITLDPLGAAYMGIQVSDLWMRSTVYDRHSTSLNNRQAIANEDGSFTLILSRKDPGYVNWLDAGNLGDGIVMVRWELLSGPVDVNSAIRQVRKIRLSDLDSHLAGTQKKVSPGERVNILEKRHQAYQFRLTE